jgi:ribonuclease T1
VIPVTNRFKSRVMYGVAAAAAALALAASGSAALAKRADTAIGEIAATELPKQARDTLALIKKGGPFPYRKDGTVFGNREGILPKKPRGYYHEYTVKTPFSRDRGARRIVAGDGASGDPATSGEYYYTDDHYASFKRIRE